MYVKQLILRCHHSTSGKFEHALKPSTKNTNCPSTIKIKVSKLRALHEAHLATITIDFCHNHSLESADALRFRKPTEEVVDKFTKLFSLGHSPASAIHAHYLDLMLENDAYKLRLADRSIFPDSRWVHHVFQTSFKKQYGKHDGILMEEQVQKLSLEMEDKGGRIKFSRDSENVSCILYAMQNSKLW